MLTSIYLIHPYVSKKILMFYIQNATENVEIIYFMTDLVLGRYIIYSKKLYTHNILIYTQLRCIYSVANLQYKPTVIILCNAQNEFANKSMETVLYYKIRYKNFGGCLVTISMLSYCFQK